MCDNGVKKNIGYYFRISFPNIYDNSQWCFKSSEDFTNGGISMLDGTRITENKERIADKISLHFCTYLTKANHLLEIFGSSSKDVN